jgi:ribonuclease HII
MKEKFFKSNTIGIDEVGRGAIAGPVVASAVLILTDQSHIDNIGIDDSKAMSERKRQEVHDKLMEMCRNGLIQYGLGVVDQDEIDKFGIVSSTNRAMELALRQIDYIENKTILVDGIVNPFTGLKVETIVKGDAKCYNIASASIIAKVFRDKLMVELSKDNLSCYNWERNKGYGSAEHIRAIKLHGLSQHHRKSFCKKFIYV